MVLFNIVQLSKEGGVSDDAVIAVKEILAVTAALEK